MGDILVNLHGPCRIFLKIFIDDVRPLAHDTSFYFTYVDGALPPEGAHRRRDVRGFSGLDRADALHENRQGLVEEVVADRERGKQTDDVSVRSTSQDHDAAFEAVGRNILRG